MLCQCSPCKQITVTNFSSHSNTAQKTAHTKWQIFPVTQHIKQLRVGSDLISCLPEKPGVKAAIFLANSSLFTSVFSGARCTLKIDALKETKRQIHLVKPLRLKQNVCVCVSLSLSLSRLLCWGLLSFLHSDFHHSTRILSVVSSVNNIPVINLERQSYFHMIIVWRLVSL